jgi:hypothetical protein
MRRISSLAGSPFALRDGALLLWTKFVAFGGNSAGSRATCTLPVRRALVKKKREAVDRDFFPIGDQNPTPSPFPASRAG